MSAFLPAEIIKKKRDGLVLTDEEIQFMVAGFTAGTIPDYQMSSLLMAIFFRGMNESETNTLTECMFKSGAVIDLSKIKKMKVDKHSTGGVGDKTSLILGPIVAAAGVPVPMISGRGLGHTGGTLDKLESIPGFKINLTLDEFVHTLMKIGICFIGQTAEICPADKKIYALRDVTATVESLPLICASIMSKKIAEGSDGLVLDVKYGSGAFIKDPVKAKMLATNLMAIGKTYGKKVCAILSQMDQPLGRFAGNSLEVYESLEILKNHRFIGSHGRDLYAETRNLSLELAALMLHLTGREENLESARLHAEHLLISGAALKKFEELIAAHGGRLKNLQFSKNTYVVKSPDCGFIDYMDTEKIGTACILIGAGRSKMEDQIDPTAGIEFHAKIGDALKEGDPLFTLYGENTEAFMEAEQALLKTVRFSSQKRSPPPLIKEWLF